MSALALNAVADNWMGRLDGTAYVAQLSIPGTHDCATGNGFSGIIGTVAGSSMAKTQDLSLTDQWNKGVRAFDLRPAMSGSDIYCYHGPCQTSLSFNGAINTLCDLLDANPTEFAICLVQHETDGDSNSDAWAGKMQTVMSNARYYGQLVPFRADLTVDDCRGKIIMISRSDFACDKVGRVNGWSHSPDFANQQGGSIACGDNTAQLFMQDMYDCTGSDAVFSKCQAVAALYAASRTLCQPTTPDCLWVITHTSGYTVSAKSDGNRDLAAQTNSALLDLLSEPSLTPGPAGIVMMDFAGADTSNGYNTMGAKLIKAVIDHNFRYTPRSLASAQADIVKPTPTSDADAQVHWHTLTTPRRGHRSLSVGPDGSLASTFGVEDASGHWKLRKRPDGKFDIVNRRTGECIDPLSAPNNSSLKMTGQSPAQGWKYSKVSGTDCYVIYSDNAQLHQTDTGHSYAVFNWGLSAGQPNRTDPGCLFRICRSCSEPNPDYIPPVESAVDEVGCNIPTMLFDLQGRRLQAPRTGVYIKNKSVTLQLQ